MVASKRLIAEFSELAARAICSVGFRKRSGDIYTRRINNDTLGWIGLNRAIHSASGVLEINPVVGVRNQAVEQMVARMTGQKLHSYIPPTVSAHLGYLMDRKEYTPWFFGEDEDNASAVRKMVSAIRAHGLPFMEANATLDALCETIANSRYGWPEQLAYRLPLVYYLTGEVVKAKEVLDSHLEALGQRADPAAEEYRGFAVELRKRL
jgi:hypothetical protein